MTSDVALEQAMLRMVAGAIRCSVDAHGPISKDGVGSAAKRVVNQLLKGELIDTLQAENARLLQANMAAGIKAGELTAKLLDCEATLYKCREMIVEKNRLVDDLQAKLLDAEIQVQRTKE